MGRHAENVALALAVCRRCGISEADALRGVLSVIPDIGALRVMHARLRNTEIIYIHAFAANDPVSVFKIWQHERVAAHHHIKTVILVNNRSDRPERINQMIDLLTGHFGGYTVWAAGDGSKHFCRQLRAGGWPSALVRDVSAMHADDLMAHLSREGKRVCLLGVGNIQGLGLSVFNWFLQRSNLLSPE